MAYDAVAKGYQAIVNPAIYKQCGLGDVQEPYRVHNVVESLSALNGGEDTNPHVAKRSAEVLSQFEQAKNSQCCSGDDKGKGGKCC